MKFWDASAVVPLLTSESTSADVQAVLVADPVMLVWWSTAVECGSAIARLERDGHLQASAADQAFARLQQLSESWHEVEPVDAVRETALRLLRVHPLRAADALQLAAAVIVAERRPSSMEVVTLDDRLAAAARKEGFVLTC